MPLYMAELQIKWNGVKNCKNVFLWPSGMYMNQSGCAVAGKQRVVCRSPHQCCICLASYVIKHGCIPSECIQNDSHCCSRWILLYWVDSDQWVSEWINKRKKQYTLLVSTGWAMLAYQLLGAERERERGWGRGWYVHSFKNLWSSIFDCTPLVISTMLRTSLSMPKKGNIFNSKQKHSFSQGAFVCEHEDLSERFEVVCTQKDGLRWVIFSPENMGQLISYYHNMSTSTLKSNRVIVRRTVAQNKWRGMMQVERMLDKIGIVHWMSLSNTHILWITLLYLTNCTIFSQEICFRGSQCYKCSLLVSRRRHNVSLTSQMDFRFARLFEILWIP